jgi:hypothetical protein
VHNAGAGRTEAPQAAQAVTVGPELDFVERRSAGLLAAQAIKPSRPAGSFPAEAPPLQEVDQIHSADDHWVAAMDRLQPALEPVPDGARGGLCHLGGLPHVVRAQPLDPPGRMSPVCHET